MGRGVEWGREERNDLLRKGRGAAEGRYKYPMRVTAGSGGGGRLEGGGRYEGGGVGGEREEGGGNKERGERGGGEGAA